MALSFSSIQSFSLATRSFITPLLKALIPRYPDVNLSPKDIRNNLLKVRTPQKTSFLSNIPVLSDSLLSFERSEYFNHDQPLNLRTEWGPKGREGTLPPSQR